MQRPALILTALALGSLGAACTSSESLSPRGTAGAAGMPAPSYAPYLPGDEPSTVPTGEPGAGGAVGQAGAAGFVSVGPDCPAAAPAGPVGMASLFQPDLSGPVVSAAVPPRPISGGTLLVLRDGSAALASDPDRDVVTVIDLATRAVRATVALRAGDEPGRLVEDGSGLVHVALRRSGALATIDPVSGRLSRREPVCAAPRGLAYDAATDLVHVACAEGALVSVHAAGGVVRSVPLARDLRDVVVTGAGKLLVSTFRSAEVLVVDGNGVASTSMRPPSRHSVTSSGPRTLSPSVAWRMVPVGAGAALVLHQRGVDEPVSPTPGGYAAGKACDGIVESTTTIVAPGAETATSPALALVTLAVDVAVSPDGQSLALAVAGNSRGPLPSVVSLAMASLTQGSGGCIPGSPPTLPPTADGSFAGMSSPPPGQVVSVAYAPSGVVVAQSRDPATLWTSDGKAPISLSNEPTADTGHELFHVDAGGGIACASCHPEGGEDGRVWSFACLGPRRTQSLRGGLSGTEPFHWDGDMASFPQLVKEVFVGRMSGPQPTDAQSAAMLHWLDSIPELPSPPPAAPDAIERGRTLFASAALGCTTCHAGARLTNNATVDVGTGGKMQVPSLRGVAWRAPYLHTGCAPTLADRFGACGGGNQHGHTSQLGAGDVSDLTAYLETL